MSKSYREGFRSIMPVMLISIIMATLALSWATVAGPVPVRFLEGITHGFLLVRSPSGETVGHGEITQVVKDTGVAESRLVFNFKDGSLHDEKVAFSQERVFTLITYQLIQRGPSFPEQMEVMFDRGTSKYQVRSQTGDKGQERVFTGNIDLPKDAYNGMIVTTLLNLPKGTNETVNVVAFTPEPTVISLELSLEGEHAVRIGNQSRKAAHYVFKPDISPIKKFLGKVLGKLPADFHYDCYILVDEVPSFVRFEGPLQLMGPVLNIELISPQLPLRSEDQRHAAK